MTVDKGAGQLTMEQQALGALSEPELVAPALKAARPLVRVWHHDARGDYRSWLLWTGRRPAEPAFKVRRVVWARNPSKDLGGGDPAASGPRLVVADGDVSAGKWLQLRSEAEKLVLPPLVFTDDLVGTDGVVFGIEQKSFRRTLRFEWWWKPPAGWEGLSAWVERTIDFFEASLNERKG